MMNLKKMIVLIICYPIYGCGDYPSGYNDGYESIDKKQWVIFGRSEYLDGFYAGEAEKLQQDWLAENLTEMNLLECPVVTIRADPLMFLPPEYKRVAPDTYQIDNEWLK